MSWGFSKRYRENPDAPQAPKEAGNHSAVATFDSRCFSSGCGFAIVLFVGDLTTNFNSIQRACGWLIWRSLVWTASLSTLQAEGLWKEKRDVRGPPAFRLIHLDGESAPSTRPKLLDASFRVRGLFYGEMLTNVIVLKEHPGPLSRQELALDPSRNSGAMDFSPARPSPSFDETRWTSEHGLPGNKIRSLLQTSDGFLWVGTANGLARFDGVHFRRLGDESPQNIEVHDEVIRALFEDASRRLWVGTDKGLVRLEKNSFKTVSDGGRFGKINAFAPGGGGKFWIVADGGIGVSDGLGLQWIATPEIQRPLCIRQTTAGRAWIGAENGLHEFDVETRRVSRSFLGANSAGLTKPARVFGITNDRHGRLWLGIESYRTTQTYAEPYDLAHDAPSVLPISGHARFAKDSFDRIWATQLSGDGGVVHFPAHENGAVSVSLGGVDPTQCITVDRENVVWVGGRNGLYRVRRKPFTLFAPIPGTGEPISFEFDSDGSLWSACEGALIHWAGWRVELYDVRNARIRPQVLCRDRRGALWAGCSERGIVRLERSGSDDLVWPNKMFFPELGIVSSMRRGREGRLWIGSNTGLFSFDTETAREPVRVEHEKLRDIRALLEDRVGSVWAGTADGELLQHDSKEMRVRLFTQEKPQSPIHCIFEGSDGKIWIGSSAGLRCARDGKVIRIGADAGMPERQIYGIVEDGEGRLWCNFDGGVLRVSLKSLNAWMENRSQIPGVQLFGPNDGVPASHSVGGGQSCLASHDGRLWFSKGHGTVVADPTEWPDTDVPPQIFVERMWVDGHPIQLPFAGSLPPATKRELEFEFTVASIDFPERTFLQYQLLGYDANWRNADVSRRARYTLDRPGKYQFLVRARSPTGHWNLLHGISLQWEAPWWRRTRAVVLAGFALASLCVLLLVWLSRRKLNRYETLRRQEIERERSRIARDLHDHLGADLSEIAFRAAPSGDSDKLNQAPLDTLNELIWSIQPDHDSIESLVNYISDASMRILSSAGISVDLALPETMPIGKVSNNVRRSIAALAKEALRNIVQHASAKRVLVKVNFENGVLSLSFKDDGCGFDVDGIWDANGAGGQRAGNGLKNFRSRCVELGAQCHVKSIAGSGTSVEFFIPLASSELSAD